MRAAALALVVALAAGACGADATELASRTTSTTSASSTSPPTTSRSEPAATATTASTAPPTTTTTVPPLPPTDAGPLDGATIVVDPGHNGANYLHPVETSRPVDAGGYLSESCNTTGTAAADGYTESAFNWEVATLVAEQLRRRGATVVLTRAGDDGWGPCIDQRGKVAHANGADALVSIHADGFDPTGYGFHVIRPGLVPGYTDRIVDPSRSLAAALRDTMLAAGFLPATYVSGSPVVERADLATLNNARVPAVMLEAGNMRNPFEALVLRDGATQQRLALAVADAVEQYLADDLVR